MSINITQFAETLNKKGVPTIPIKMPDKRPAVKSWKQFQNRFPNPGELNYNGALALICGKVSGNVEVIDVDVKNLTGNRKTRRLFLNKLKRAIKKACPGLWEKLVIQETPSYGIHYIYRCNVIEGSQHLAENEQGKVIIETRGEGAYVGIHPSPGYKLLQGKFTAIKSITPKQREKLFEVCKSFNECKQDEMPTSTASTLNQFDEASLEHLTAWVKRNKIDITKGYKKRYYAVLQALATKGEKGRPYVHSICQYHEDYNKEKCDKDFTACLKQESKSTLEEKSKLRLGTLINVAKKHGYKPSKKLAKDRFKAIASQSEDVVISIDGNWALNPNPRARVEYMVRIGLRLIKTNFGYDWIHVDGNRHCVPLSPVHAARLLNELILRDYPQATNLVNDSLIDHEVSALIPVLTDEDFLHDTATSKYYPFKNWIIKCEGKRYRKISWDKNDKYVWKENVIDHNFKDPGKNWKRGNIFFKFMENIHNPEVHKINYVMQVLGYAAHNHKKVDDDQVIMVLGNQKVKHSDNKGAGSGKSLLAGILEHVGRQLFIPGDTFDPMDKFAWQGLERHHTSILIDDYAGKFSPFKTMSTGSWTVEKKHQPSFSIAKELSPKIIITSPEIPDITDEGNKRRILPIVVSDFYYDLKQKGDPSPVTTVHGKRLFGEGFTERDWNGFYRFMIECSTNYLKKRPDPKPVFKTLFNRFAYQSFEDDELVDTIKKLPLNKTIIIENYHDKFKQEEQTLVAFAKVFRKILRSLNYTFEEKRMPIKLVIASAPIKAKKKTGNKVAGTSKAKGKNDGENKYAVCKRGEDGAKSATTLKIIKR